MKKHLLLILVLSLVLAIPSEGYQQVNPKLVGKNLKKFEGKNIKFTDRILFVWKAQPLTKKDKSGYIKFETQNLRCIMRETAARHLNTIKKRLGKRAPRYLTFYGTVVKKFEFQYYVEIFRVEFPKYLKK